MKLNKKIIGLISIYIVYVYRPMKKYDEWKNIHHMVLLLREGLFYTFFIMFKLKKLTKCLR